MNCAAVIGLGFGDEGKGLVTDLLVSQADDPLVVRFSGGQQAGHTVWREDGTSHVFSNFGSGSLRGAPTFWSRFCTLDPVGVLNEFRVLGDAGVRPRLYIDHRCPVTTPYDILHNREAETRTGHGSCGVGVGATWEREENGHSLLYGDLFHPPVLKIKMDLIRRYYGIDAHVDDFFEAAAIITGHESIGPGSEDVVRGAGSVIFEGSQGLLLDRRIGFFPHVTRSDTGSASILAMGYAPALYLVTRAYQTRHGNGPMTNEDIPHSIRANPAEKNEVPSYQGAFRKSLLDIDLLRYAIGRDGYVRDAAERTLVVTCLDLTEGDYRFTENGKIVRCESESEFVSAVQSRLGIGRAHGVRSPLPHLAVKL